MEINKHYGYGEIAPFDDYRKPSSSGKKEVFGGYLNDPTDRTETDRKKWAEDTDDLAKHSIRFHILETILKIPTYFLTHSDFHDTWIAKAVFTAERMTGACGDMFRNQIYGHKDKNGNRDDNVGAEEFTKSEKEQNSWIPSLGIINNQLQTKGRFLVAALGLVNLDIANDLDWAFINLFDSMWWRNMGNNLAFGPNFSHKLYKSIAGKFFGTEDGSPEDKTKNNKNEISWNYIKNKFQEHKTELAKSWNELNRADKSNPERIKECKINISQHLDKTISCFTPIINWLNVFGDIARPIARRLDIQGLPRTLIRSLSVIDKPLEWCRDIFRFYLPEKLMRDDKDRNKLFPSVTLADLIPAYTFVDMLDFGFIVGENRLKESSGNLQHLIEIGRRLKDSAQDIYFSVRRRRPFEENYTNKKSPSATQS